MTWKKKLLLPLLVVSFSLLLSVFGCEKQANATYRNITGFQLSSQNFSLLDTGGSNAFKLDLFTTGAFDNLRVKRLGTPSFTFNNTLRSNKEHGILLDFFVLVTNTYSDAAGLLAAPFCPDENPNMNDGRYSVFSCTAEVISRDVFIDTYGVHANTGSSNYYYDNIEELTSNTYYIFHYKIIAYNTSSSYVSTTNFSLSGPLVTLAHRDLNRINHSILYVLFNYAEDGKLINQKSADEKMNDKDDQDRADLENQSSDTSDSADEQGEEASQTGTTLLGVFSAFVSALATIHTTNCKLPSMTIYGMQLGQMDLCTFDVPPGIVALATIGMVFIIVPLSFNLARRLVNIFRSFQG